MQPRESGSGVVRREKPIIYIWEAVRSVHRRGGGGARAKNRASVRLSLGLLNALEED